MHRLKLGIARERHTGGEADLAGHVVGDQAEVAGVHADAVGAEHAPDLGHHRPARSFDAKGAQHRADVVAGDRADVHEVVIDEGALKVDAIRLHAELRPWLVLLLLHHIAAVNACSPVSQLG